MNIELNNDYTERYIGASEVKIPAIKPGAYTISGIFGRYIGQNTDAVSEYAGQKVFENMQGNEYAAVAAVACEFIVKLGMCAFRKLLNNHDAHIANKYIIQLLKYCRNDISQYSNIVVDSNVDGILSSLALPRSQARIIYRDSRINSLSELPNVMFGKEDKEALGYMLYYMERAFGIECKEQVKLNEIFEYLDLGYDIWEKYENYYIDDAVKRTTQVQVAEYLFKNIQEDKYKIDGYYYRSTLRKLARYYPAGVESRIKKGLTWADKIVAIIENDEQVIANIMAEAGGMVFDGNSRQNKDIFMEQYQIDMYNITGMGGNDFNRNKVDINIKDIRETVHC